MENGRFAFFSSLGGLGTTYNVHLGLTELFSLGVMAEALRANIG